MDNEIDLIVTQLRKKHLSSSLQTEYLLVSVADRPFFGNFIRMKNSLMGVIEVSIGLLVHSKNTRNLSSPQL
jgi:hypothetical protein